MKCEEYQELIAAEAPGAEEHLAECAACRKVAEELRWTREALAGLAEEPLDEVLLAEVRTAVLERVGRRRWPVWVGVAAAAMLALAIALAPQLTTEPPPPPEPGVAVIPTPELRLTPPAPAPKPRKQDMASARKPVEPMVIKMLTDDPDVVIVWLVEGSGDGK